MRWKNLPITSKFFAAIFITALLVVLTMAVPLIYVMHDGFSHYLLSAEITRTSPVQEGLLRDYDPTADGWPMIDGTLENWIRYTKKEMDAKRPHPPKAPGGIDPFQIGLRMVLLDANRQKLAGSLNESDETTEAPLILADGPQAGKTVGYLALRAPRIGPSFVDSVYLRGYYRMVTLSAGLALVLSAITAFILARFLVAPLHSLAENAETLAAGDYSSRLQESGRNDEVGRLIQSFNRLGESLEATSRAERRWISDTSHELKTPIAILRAEIEAVQDGVRAANDTSIGTLHSAVMRLTDLVEDLNDLSLAREGRLVVAVQEQDLTAIVQEATETTRRLIEDAGLTLETDLESDLFIICDARRMNQLMFNLLENSRRYTTAPGSVRVALKRGDRTVRISVDDSPPEPPEQSLEMLFDRFYRVDSSRARKLGGSGLGLAICQSIANGHGGKIDVGPSELGGLRVVVTLPVREVPNAG